MKTLKKCFIYLCYLLIAAAAMCLSLLLLNQLGKVSPFGLMPVSDTGQVGSDILKISIDVLRLGYLTLASLVLAWVAAGVVTFIFIVWDNLVLISIVRHIFYALALLPVIVFAVIGHLLTVSMKPYYFEISIVCVALMVGPFFAGLMFNAFEVQNREKYFLIYKLNNLSNFVILFKLFKAIFVKPVIESMVCAVPYVLGLSIVFMMIFGGEKYLLAGIETGNWNIFMPYLALTIVLGFVLTGIFYFIRKALERI